MHHACVTDKELASGIARRDTNALETLIETYHRPVLRYLWQAGGSKEDAEDLAVQTLLRVRAEIRGYRGEGSLRSWIYQVAYRELLRHRRRQTFARLFASRQPTARMESFNEDAVVVYDAIARIPAPQRDAFLLTEAEGLTTEEAAAALGIPAGTVKSRCHHARLKLRKLLGATYGETYANAAND